VENLKENINNINSIENNIRSKKANWQETEMQMPAKNQRGIIAFQSNVHTLISFPTVSIKSDQFTALTSRPGLIDLVRSKGNFGRIGSEFIKKNEN